MDLFISTFVILLGVVFSNITSEFFPHISNKYINILIGIIFGLIPMVNRLVLNFNSEVFMVLILAPLLFFEGQMTPVQFVRSKLKSIAGTAFVLAIASAAIVAITISWGFQLSLSLGLLIVAISVPTDATAFDSVLSDRRISNRVRGHLKVESLFNDATGLILLQAALLWMSTGHLSFWHNSWMLVVSTVGGIAIGVLVSMLIMMFRQTLVRSNFNVISSQTLIYVVTPICIYLLAEEVGVSGIIAVVTAGLVHNSEAIRSRFSSPRQMHIGLQLENLLTDVLNSVVFVVLGIMLTRIVIGQRTTMFASLEWLWIGITVYLLLLALRYLYARVWVGDRSRESSGVFALGGVHGTVTLAMAFSILGQSMVSQATFNFVILAETVVILLSMIIPTITFKFVLPIDLDERNRKKQTNRLRVEMVNLGIERVEQMELSSVVKRIVIYDLQDQLRQNSIKSFFRQWLSVNRDHEVLTGIQSVEQRRALMYAFDCERDYLYDLAQRHVVNSEYVYDLYSELLLSESLVLDPYYQVL